MAQGNEPACRFITSLMQAEVPCLVVEEIDGSPRYVSAAWGALGSVSHRFTELRSHEASLAAPTARP